MRKVFYMIIPLLIILITVAAYLKFNNKTDNVTGTEQEEKKEVFISEKTFDINSIPEYENDICIVINNDIPFFNEDDLKRDRFIKLSSLDELGRAGMGIMMVDKNDIQNGERGEIGFITGSGWNQNKYPGIIDSEPAYLYNRSHILLWKCTGNDYSIPENILTGTRDFNQIGMWSCESEVLSYLYHSDNRVLYRVTPYYDGDNLLAAGVLIEAVSVEDGGAGLHFCRWVYNVQQGIKIDYSDGSNCAE